MVSPRVLVLGTGADAPYHPLAPLKEPLLELFSPFGEVFFSTDREEVLSGLSGSGAPDLLVLLGDEWERPVSDRSVAALTSWVSSGGRALILHQGISLQARSEVSSLLGARFTGHPEATVLAFRPLGALADAGCGAWRMADEPYRFSFDPNAAVEPLLEYQDAQGVHPAGWRRRFCLGTLVYLSPGHAGEHYREEGYRRAVTAAASLLLGPVRRR